MYIQRAKSRIQVLRGKIDKFQEKDRQMLVNTLNDIWEGVEYYEDDQGLMITREMLPTFRS